ncbi:hypothetical protein POB01_002652 [Enterococcus faecalis]|uniref:hypothetical protein n=1 Tax=Enterococcus faecalis TaxID=1351 RepID=UPI000CF16798|nr:hypothetical protein [Enterococcus faecalis]EGO9359143.1 hypothetical protein [Enterococcus faecalis]EKK5902238.1 hypothetical protein [Enterococcus faecalis]PQB75286.1 hypothetical protein CUN23_03830 [Enterococcus faecalis]PQG21753.1 hypothetical protein CUS25_05225 [Enterococcus faecalis]PQG60837.1 hypothetical protein CUS54_07130 [Enterococcus faecalis]
MIKFKEFDVGDIHYEEQIEQFQKEHQNAEFIQITGGYTSYEKIWFKYDDGIEQPEFSESQQIVLDWLKESCKLHGLREVIEIMGFLSTTGGKMKYKQVAYAYGDLNDDELAQVLQSFSQWVWEQEEK